MAHRKVCALPRCPEKTHGRITDGKKRFDLCLAHFRGVTAFYGSAVEIVEVWAEEPPVINVDLLETALEKVKAATKGSEDE